MECIEIWPNIRVFRVPGPFCLSGMYPTFCCACIFLFPLFPRFPDAFGEHGIRSQSDVTHGRGREKNARDKQIFYNIFDEEVWGGRRYWDREDRLKNEDKMV